MIFTWTIGSLIISQGYAGNLKAHLTKPSLTPPIDTLEKFARSGLPMAVNNDGEEENLAMEVSTDPTIRHIWDNKMENITLYPLNVR